jgi:membrane protein
MKKLVDILKHSTYFLGEIVRRIVVPALKVIGWSLADLWLSFMQPKRSSAALTYHTLFAIVPVLSLMVAVAKGLGYAEMFRNQIKDFMQGQEIVSIKLLSFTDSYLDNTHMHSWLGASVGLIVLLYSVFSIFQTIDEEFNHQWDEKGRSFLKLLKTFSVVLVLPFVVIVLLVIWWSVSSYFKGSIMFNTNALLIAGLMHVWWLFLMYKYIPKCRVDSKCAFLSAVVTGLVFCLMQYFSYTILSFFSNYRNVYGDLASLLIFLLWIYFSWTICLAGAHWTYLLQTASKKRLIDTFESTSFRYHRFLTFVFVKRIISIYPSTLTFVRSEFIRNMENEYDLPEQIVESVVNRMDSLGLIVEEGEDEFRLISTIVDLTDESLIARLDTFGEDRVAQQVFSKLHQDRTFNSVWNRICN